MPLKVLSVSAELRVELAIEARSEWGTLLAFGVATNDGLATVYGGYNLVSLWFRYAFTMVSLRFHHRFTKLTHITW